jgi:hypothetical protein
MTIALQPITHDIWVDCISLNPTEEQMRSSFVAPNSVSLAQAHYEPWWQLYTLSFTAPNALRVATCADDVQDAIGEPVILARAASS